MMGEQSLCYSRMEEDTACVYGMDGCHTECLQWLCSADVCVGEYTLDVGNAGWWMGFF